MPEQSLSDFNLDGKTPSELEQRRRSIIETIKGFPKSYDDPELPLDLLRELALVTGTLRRSTAGPPKRAKPSKRPSGAPKATVSDLKGLLS